MKSFSNEDWVYLSQNNNLTLEFVEKHLDELWSWRHLSGFLPLTIEFVERHLDKAWNYGCIGFSANPSVTLEFIEHFPSQYWDYGYYGLSRNLTITEEFIESHLERYYSKNRDPTTDWVWHILPLNPNLSLEFIDKYIDESERESLRKDTGVKHSSLLPRHQGLPY